MDAYNGLKAAVDRRAHARNRTMTKSELADSLSRQAHLMRHDAETGVDVILEAMTRALCRGDRIEIRGFGSFILKRLPPRTIRHPKTGEFVLIPTTCMARFKPGKDLRLRVRAASDGL